MKRRQNRSPNKRHTGFSRMTDPHYVSVSFLFEFSFLLNVYAFSFCFMKISENLDGPASSGARDRVRPVVEVALLPQATAGP